MSLTLLSTGGLARNPPGDIRSNVFNSVWETGGGECALCCAHS
eukprot:COSAG01_NODE_363_length_18113_cov_45.041690_9_plen_43_part_00